MPPRPAAQRRTLVSSPFNASRVVNTVVTDYQVDDRVCHDRHGLGRIVKVEDGHAVIVDFGGGTMMRVTITSTKLTKL